MSTKRDQQPQGQVVTKEPRFAAFGAGNFRRYFIGQIISSVGSSTSNAPSGNRQLAERSTPGEQFRFGDGPFRTAKPSSSKVSGTSLIGLANELRRAVLDGNAPVERL